MTNNTVGGYIPAEAIDIDEIINAGSAELLDAVRTFLPYSFLYKVLYCRLVLNRAPPFTLVRCRLALTTLLRHLVRGRVTVAAM